MAIEYIKEIFDNYDRLNIEDKKQLSNRINKIQDDDSYNELYFSGHYDLNSIDEFLDLIINIKHNAKYFESFYNALNDTQKKEFQTRAYLTADNINNYYSKSDLYSTIANLVKTNEDKSLNESDAFTIDFERLESALEDADICDMSERVVAVYQNIANPNKINQIPYEIIKMIKKCLSMIKENVNDSTRNKIESLSLDKQIITTLLLLDVDKEQLNNDIEYRKKLREEHNNFYRIKRENGIKEKLDPSKKLVKTRANKNLVHMTI